MLEVELRKRRRDITVEAAFTLPAGGALALFGPSGAGKSTVLRCVAGLESPDAGLIRVGGEVWYPPPRTLHQRFLGYLGQQPGLFPHLNVAENVNFGLPHRERHAPPSPWLRRLRERLALAGCWTTPVRELSGGQAQRVALARMLVRRPPLVLLDEPFTGLDRASVRELAQAMIDWRAELGFTLLAVDHQAEVLEMLTGEVMFLEAGRATPPERWDSLRSRPDHSVQALLAPLQAVPDLVSPTPGERYAAFHKEKPHPSSAAGL